jgi:probable rRNA maturation factor
MGRSAGSRQAVRPDLLPNVSVQVFEQFGEDVPGEWVTDVASITLFQDTQTVAESVSVVIADDETVAIINEEYRGLPGVTDVLSFSNVHSGAYYGDDDRSPSAEMIEGFVMSPDFDPGLGEVIISYPQTCRQARAAGRTAKAELAQLVAHGILHLIGYDHEEPAEAARMRSKERQAMTAFAERGLLE